MTEVRVSLFPKNGICGSLIFVIVNPFAHYARRVSAPGGNLAQKFGGRRKFRFCPRKPLISLKTAKAIFGNIWTIGPQIWKCLARVWNAGARCGERFNLKATFPKPAL
jgi:hypothetical protein